MTINEIVYEILNSHAWAAGLGGAALVSAYFFAKFYTSYHMRQDYNNYAKKVKELGLSEDLDKDIENLRVSPVRKFHARSSG